MKENPSTEPLDAVVPESSLVHFYIPATTSLVERRPRTLKHGDTFAVFDHYGDITAGDGSPEGLYHEDTRFLSGFQLLINGRRPLLLSSTVQDNNVLLMADLTNPDFFSGDRPILPRDTIHIVRSKFLWQGTCYERLAIRNFDDRSQAISLHFLFQSDFADLFEVRGHKRPRRGRLSVAIPSGDTVVFRYGGLDSVARRTTIHFEPMPVQLDKRAAVLELNLAPQERTSIFVTITCTEGPVEKPRQQHFFVRLREARRTLRGSTSRAASVETSNHVFNELLCRSMADLYMLITDTEQGPFPYAGIPWFNTAFGRDGIITAGQMLWIDPAIAKGVLKFLAATQAREHDPDADAEPGKILHETRCGEMARLGEVPFGLYYGAVDTTPLFVMLAGMYFERTGDVETIGELWPNLEAALRWTDDYGDRDGDGFVEYHKQSPDGLANQGWKDSQDSVFHADGRLAVGPIALSEVQGYVYCAKVQAAGLARALGFGALAATLDEQAAALKERFDAAFWCDEISTYALALDGEKKPCRVRTSNAGQVLFTGIAKPERAALIANMLLGQEFFSGWGVRTVASSEARYNPMSYHNGSVWPHDNALIALGFARYGLHEHIQRLFSGIFDAGVYMDLRRLPELFCGFRRRAGKGPTLYPVACSPQAWASAAPFALIKACLGLGFDHRTEEVRFSHPRLPDFLDKMVIRSLTVGGSRMDLMLRRYGSDVTVNVLDKVGDGRVVVTH